MAALNTLHAETGVALGEIVLKTENVSVHLGGEPIVSDVSFELRAGEVLAVIGPLHDLAAAAAYADRVLLLHGGQMRQCGSPFEVLTAELLSEVYGHPVRVLRERDDSFIIVPLRFVDESPEASVTIDSVFAEQEKKGLT